MNAPAKFDRVKPFNSFAAYQRERAHSRRMEQLLSKALMLLSMECQRRKLRGEDVEHIEAFITEASK